MAFLITTTGTVDPVVFNDVGGLTFAHPTVDFDLETILSIDEITGSADIQNAIASGAITVTDGSGNTITSSNQIFASNIEFDNTGTSFIGQTVQAVLKETDTLISSLQSSNHSQNTDQYLDFGGPNQVSAAQVKAAYDHSQLTSGNPHGVTASDVGADPAGTAATEVSNHVAAVDPHTQYQKTSEKGVANGYASLDNNGTVPLAQLPSSVQSGLNYKGVWDASTNTPALADNGVGGSSGDYYKVSVAGTTLIDGVSDWQIGDWIINNGSTWDKVDNTDQVSSVFGRQGAVVAQTGDYNADQITETANSKIMTAAERTKLAGIEPGAQVNVNADWNATSGDALILNKPTDVTDLSLHSVTELSDITSAGSGSIITTAERNKIHDPLTLGGIAGDTTNDTLDLVGQTLTVNLATASTDGAMSAADKAKLDSLVIKYPVRFVLNGKYSKESTGTKFDGAMVVPNGGIITSVSVVHSTPSGSGTGSTEIDVTINGSTIWTSTTPPTIVETDSTATTVNTASGDNRTIPVNGIIEVSIGTKTTYTGEPKDLSVIIMIEE